VQAANKHRAANAWDDALTIYIHLLTSVCSYGEYDPLAAKAAVICTEFFRQMCRTIKLCDDQCRDPGEIMLLAVAGKKRVLARKLKRFPFLATIVDIFKEKGLEEGLEELDEELKHGTKKKSSNNANRASSLDEATEGRAVRANDGLYEGEDKKTMRQERDFRRMMNRRYVPLPSNTGIGSIRHDADLMGHTELHIASMNPDKPWIKNSHSLRKLNPNVLDSAGWTPLHHLVSHAGSTHDQLWALISRGAEINIHGFDGMAPLHCAARSGRWDLAKLLIECGANVEIQDYSKRTPLHWAA